MGREIRRVPPNWEHPTRDCPHSPWQGGCTEAKRNNGRCSQPLYDHEFDEAARDWKERFASWERGERPSWCDESSENLEFWERNGAPPNRDYYRPKWTEEPTWFQVYETVSEGTPVTPPFATEDELIDYLVQHGDFWDQQRGDGGWARENAERFVRRGFAMSLVVEHSAAGTTIKAPKDQ